jgi:hypothetical protein
MLRLLVVHNHEERIFTVPEGEAQLGSALENDIVLPFPGVSRRHALVRRHPGGVEIEDLRSKNGLRFEGQRIKRAILIPGLQLQIGAAWIELEEISSSEEGLALILKDGRRFLSTATLKPEKDLKDSSAAGDALTLAYHIAEVGMGLPGKRSPLLARIKATLGAQAFASFERTRRGNLRIWESEGKFLAEEMNLLASLASDSEPAAQEQAVVLKRAGRLLMAGHTVWFLGASFSEESLASEGWRKDLLRFLAHESFLPVRRLDDVNSAEASRVLALARGNKKRAASLLGISRGTLYKLLAPRSIPKG